MSRYLDRVVGPDEKILYRAHMHWILYARGLATTFLGALLGHYAAPLTGLFLGGEIQEMVAKPSVYVAMGVIALGALQLLVAFIWQVCTELVITNRRVIAKYGFVATTTFEVMIPKVEGANIDQTVMGRLLGYGTIMVRGTGGGISPIGGIADPYGFHTALLKVLETTRPKAKSSLSDEPMDD